jgi:hypothetical protein
MSQLILDFPETLRQLLEARAKVEGVAVNDFVIDALTQRITSVYTMRVVPDEEIAQQRASFAALLRSLRRASRDEVAKVLAERDIVESETLLNPEVSARVKILINEQRRNYESGRKINERS